MNWHSLVALETGKPVSDAALEVSIAIDHLSWATRNAHRYLQNSHRAPGLLMFNMSTHVEHEPYGVIESLVHGTIRFLLRWALSHTP